MNNKEVEYINTKQLALILGGLKPQTIHKGFCKKGHYMSLVPVKLKNGRLLCKKKDVIDITNLKLDFF